MRADLRKGWRWCYLPHCCVPPTPLLGSPPFQPQPPCEACLRPHRPAQDQQATPAMRADPGAGTNGARAAAVWQIKTLTRGSCSKNL